MVQHGARWCKMVQDGAGYAEYAEEITADGAYHCPVGSIRPFLKKYLGLVQQLKLDRRLFANDTLSLCHILYDSQRLPSKGSTCASIKENIQGRHRSVSEI